MPENLSRFIEHARQKGIDYATVFLILRSSGWKEKEIVEAVAAGELGLPIPERVAAGSARDTFLHLLAFTALYVAACSLIFLLFTCVDFAFPDPALRAARYMIEYGLQSIRFSLAALLVSFPLFVLVWWYLLREARRSPQAVQSAVRRWLSYLSLFVGSVTVMGDLITLLYYLIEGQLTVRFLLKVLILLVVAGGLILYLSLTLRAEGGRDVRARRNLAFAFVGPLIVAFSIAWGFYLVGSPAIRRMERIDETRVEELHAIASEIHWMVVEQDKPKRNELPTTLQDVAKRAHKELKIFDPETGELYGYTVDSETTFELCATFERGQVYESNGFWSHSAGRHCFQFNVRIPPLPAPPRVFRY